MTDVTKVSDRADRRGGPVQSCGAPTTTLRAWGWRAATVAAAVVVLSAPVGAAAASTPPPGPPASAGSVGADQAEAARLATQIQYQGLQLNRLAEQADAAQLRAQQVTSQLAATRTEMAQIDRRVATARAVLREEAVAAYVGEDAPLTPTAASQRAGEDPSLTTSYAEIVAGEQRHSISDLRRLLGQQGTAARRLGAEQASARLSAAQLKVDQQAAQTASQAEQSTLAGVNGQIRSLVAAAQAARTQAEALQVRANLAQQGAGLAAGAVVGPPTPAPASAHPATAPAVQNQPATGSPLRPAPVTPLPPTTTAPGAAFPSNPIPNTGPAGAPPQASGASVAIAYAYAQLGKPYQWGGAGPSSFDCSGLVMMAWGAAGVSFPHLAQDQYDLSRRVALDQMVPGDLVFFGTPEDVYHVGIYLGGGEMIDAPSAGHVVRVEGIYWSDLLGGGRVG
ncbi:MAG: C40 family peptidase [Acidimicrobiales bacterium]